jgi:carboxypeptidase family protein/TonB-dependent receptor-like protein
MKNSIPWSFAFIWRGSGLMAGTLLLGIAPLMAQLTTGSISGTVTDQTGAAVPGATVTLKNTETGISRSAVSGPTGRYDASSLPLGTYEVSASLSGFQTVVHPGIELTVGKNAMVNFALQVGEVSQSVTVAGEATQVETTTATVSNLVDAKKVEDLPLNNRDLTQLSFLQPGVIKSPAGAGAFSGLGDKLSVAGSRGNQNIYLLDGVSNSDLSGNAQSASGNLAGAETIKEFQIITNNYSAEYRSQAGAIVSAVTKSGTNAFHGSAFEFLRNDKVDAAKWEENRFGSNKSSFRRNQFGGSFGGPIIKDKTFLFASYEGLRERKGGSSIATVPSADARNGILPGRAPIAVSPVVRPYLDLYPVPGQGNTIVKDFGNGAVQISGSSHTVTNDDFALLRIDHTFSGGKAGTLSGTYNYDNGDSSSETPPGVLGDLVAQGFTSRKHVISLNHTGIWSPTILNEFKFGYSFTNPVQDIPLTSEDFSSLATRPGRNILGEIVVSPLSNIGFRQGSSDYGQKVFSGKEGLSISHGNHSFRMGVDFEHYAYSQISCSRGCFGNYTFNNIASFLQAQPLQLDIQLPGKENPPRYMNQIFMGSYFQDNWNVRPYLTLNLGLRHEFVTVPNEENGLISAMKSPYDPYMWVTKAAQKLYPNETFMGTIDGFYTNATLKSFSPRFGFAFAPGSKKTSVRGGFGVFYEHPMLYNLRTNIQDTPPFSQSGQILSADAAAAGVPLTFPNAFSSPALLGFLKGGSLTARVTDFNQKPAYIYRWSLTVQRELQGGWVVIAGYTGSRALHLWQQGEPNINKWIGWPVQPTGQKIFPLRGTPQFQGRINPNWSEIRYQYPNANSYHNDLAAGAQKRLSHGLVMQLAYTYSKTVDDGSGVTSTGDNFVQGQRNDYAWDMKLKRGLSSFDVRHSFTSNFSYNIPAVQGWNGFKGAVGKGWQINGILSVNSGFPFSVEENRTTQVNAIGNRDNLRPNLVPGGNKNAVNPGHPDNYIDPSQFVLAQVGTFGNLGRNTLISPGLIQFDGSIFKSFTLRENHKLNFRAEFFNLFNRPNFAAPPGGGSGTLPSTMLVNTDGSANPSFGQITSTRTSARQIQFALRYTF